MGNKQTQYDNVFVDDSAKNGVGVPGIFCHTPYPKVDGKYLTFAETVAANKPDGLVNNEEALNNLRNIATNSKKSKIVFWLDVDKCFDGVISLPVKRNIILMNYLKLIVNKVLIKIPNYSILKGKK